jgi:methionine-rich copper-binding protein CopC
MKRVFVALAAAIALSLGSAQAHTSLESSAPASGSILTQSPEQIVLTFHEAARLTSIAVALPNGERRLQFTPSGSATTFTAVSPNLPVGRNEVRWRALSADGHVVDGSIIIVVRPAAH